MNANDIQREARAAIIFLVHYGLADDQNLPFIRKRGQDQEVTFENAQGMGLGLKERIYKETYDEFLNGRIYNAKLIDGALIQLAYSYRRGVLKRHRLAYYPSPYVVQFQDDPELYLEDILFAEVIAKDVVPFPFRFDFDANSGVAIEIDHPVSHLTLGQFERCRIPVAAAVGPILFLEFVLRSFYNTAFKKHQETFPRRSGVFGHCILEAERRLLHIATPVEN